MSEPINAVDLAHLVHMLGAGTHIAKRSHGFRNYYAASIGGSLVVMERLVEQGLAIRGTIDGDMHYYHATEAGCDAIGLSKAAKRRALEDW